MRRTTTSGGYIGILMLLIGCAIVAALYWIQVPGLPAIPGMPPSGRNGASSTIQANLQIVQEAKKIQAARDTQNAQIEAALKEQ